MELPPSLSPLPSKSWYSDNAGVEEVIGAGTVGVVKVLEDMRVNSCFNLVLDIIHRCSGSGRTQTDRYDYDRYDRYDGAKIEQNSGESSGANRSLAKPVKSKSGICHPGTNSGHPAVIK